ncbi:MAG: MFS transporter [Rhodobacteraceae bacterium]|nr:MFS transporter [Paracoccaceae bacterium]
MKQPANQLKKKRKAIAAGLVGNILEWYDFAVYGFFAPILATLFFPSDDPVTSLIAAYGAFAAGFLMRPVGAVIFGHIGDRLGRKRALTLSIVLMAIPSLCIGLLPTYEQIGVTAGVLLVVLRMLQGVAVGGEFTGSIVYLTENAPPGRRGFFASWSLFGANGGILLGSLVGALLSYLLTDMQLHSWGWRLPFLAGVGVAIAGLMIRRSMDETENDTNTDSAVAIPLVHVLRHHKAKLSLVFGLNTGFAVVFYSAFVYMSGWLVTQEHETQAMALAINSAGLVMMCILIPIMAHISDRVGRKPVMLLGAILMVVLPYPLAWLMGHPDPKFAVMAQFGFAIAISTYVGPLPATIAELFPPNIRVTAVSVGYNLAFAVFGGTAPMLATWLIAQSGSNLGFAWYLSAMAAVSLVATLFLPSTIGTKKKSD